MSLNSLKHSAQLQRREMKMTECFTATPPHTILSAYPIERGRGIKREREEGWDEDGEKLKAERLFAELHKIGRKDCRALTLTLSLSGQC